MLLFFCNGGHLAEREMWFLGGDKMEVVNMYKYLGVFLSTRLSFMYTFEDLASRGRKGVSAILKLLWSIGEHSSNLFFKLFDC